MKLAIVLAVALAASTTTALAEDWRPITVNKQGYASVDFDGVRGPSNRRIAWVLHSLRATDPLLNYDFMLARYVVDCDDETSQLTSANHYQIDGTLRHSSELAGNVSPIAPGTTNRLLADAICSGQPPEWAGYPNAIAATLALRQHSQ